MDYHDVPDTTCPVCSKPLNGATGVDTTASPVEGSVSVCLHCASVLVFNSDLSLRQMTEQEMGTLSQEDQDDLTYARSIALRVALGAKRA